MYSEYTTIKLKNKNIKIKAQEMTQWLGVLRTVAEDPNWIPSTRVEQFTTTCNSSSRGSDTIF